MDKIEARRPKAKGMKFIRFERIPLDKLKKRPGKNTSRRAGVERNNIDKFITIMMQGKYEPEYNIPPVVTEGPNGTYYVESGEHRKEAHKELSQDPAYSEFKTYYAAVVEFHDEGGMPAQYWNEIWVTKENVEEDSFVRKRADNKDIATSVANLVKKRIISNDAISKEFAIKNMGVNPNTGTFQKIKSEVEKALGNFAGVVESITEPTQWAKKYATHNGLQQVPITATFKGGSGFEGADDSDNDYRLIRKCIAMYLKNPKDFSKKTILAHTNGADPDRVRRIRNRKADLLERFEREMRAFITKVDTSGVPFKTNIVWRAQLDGECTDDDTYTVIKWNKKK